MRLFTSLFLAFFAVFSLHAQLGVQATANFHNSSSVFLTGVGEVNVPELETGAELAVNYWFRLPKQRVEFLPTLYYAQTSDDWSAPDDNFYLKEIGFQLKTNIYPFDFLGDCDCPTFGKQGPQLQKGFFLQLSGGYSVYRGNADVEVASGPIGGNGFTYGGGIGLDIGISNLVTITPIASVRVGTGPYQELEIPNFNGQITAADGPRLTTFQLGILTSFRFDHKRY